ncbi:hypothetical protein JHK85_027179 [Glycine max]|uniref:Uncharacterized protein n=1 Tax=Glycine max TaxID=3847 RepID=A0A0R0EAN9_SOYBN|nr:hypothetical protein JHK85_027179 [Glycine max]
MPFHPKGCVDRKKVKTKRIIGFLHFFFSIYLLFFCFGSRSVFCGLDLIKSVIFFFFITVLWQETIVEEATLRVGGRKIVEFLIHWCVD